MTASLNTATLSNQYPIDLVRLEHSIDGLDLEPIKAKLIEEKDWSLEQADETEKWYKRFLFLHGLFPREPLVPTEEIDEFWHQHICDTRKYQEDCQNIFGTFLHHFPYLGMRGEEDARSLEQTASKTWALYEKYFGEPVNNLARFFTSGATAEAGCQRPCAVGLEGHLENAQMRPVPSRNQPIDAKAWRVIPA